LAQYLHHYLSQANKCCQNKNEATGQNVLNQVTMFSKDKLNEYKEKRDFDKTAEPDGKARKKMKNRFVVQQHDASNMHYDFRIEIDGILKSWAVPKGPSTDHTEKRLAMLTEDHPLDYAGFEGTIPEDEYGGGTIIVWDAGTYENLREEKEDKSIEKSFEEGKIEIWLKGKKLTGGYVLIKTSKDGTRWLLKKMDDEEADARRKPLKTEPESVLSGNTIEQMKKQMKSSSSGD
jgi:DNA ligase D-like protein (predicted 3'-phosphoesterase)